MKKLSHSKLKQVIKLSIAIHAHNLMEGFAYNDIGVSKEEYLIMVEETHKLTEKLAGKHPMNLGSIDLVLDYFRNK